MQHSCAFAISSSLNKCELQTLPKSYLSVDNKGPKVLIEPLIFFQIRHSMLLFMSSFKHTLPLSSSTNKS